MKEGSLLAQLSGIDKPANVYDAGLRIELEKPTVGEDAKSDSRLCSSYDLVKLFAKPNLPVDTPVGSMI